MSMRGAVAGCLVLACLVALLAERTEGHITFFSPKEMIEMRKHGSATWRSPRMRTYSYLQGREGRKDMEPRSEDGQFEEVTDQQPPQVELGGNPDKTVEIAVHLSRKQLDDVAPMLKDIIHEAVEDHQKAK
ncbi:motilin-like isoform X1 [Plectropomus leopardus]|uniref:motilin-like isoform X1 n=1 Tax=Plectropomus leopardus TaxID=160734 RepID=UPI001C4B2B76|nr:motilin-like isoform X1 [Plectropomus leopardus]XP_042357844.1 motilin-like isoform X1 [Plectropomus leopardus]